MRRADIRAAVLTVEPRLRPTYLALLQYADEADVARPSVPAVAELAGEHVTTTRRHLSELAAAGAIATARRSLGGRPTVWLATPPPTACAPHVDNGTQPEHRARVETHAPRSGAETDPSTTLGQPEQEPPFNPSTTRGEVLKRIEVAADEADPSREMDEARRRSAGVTSAYELPERMAAIRASLPGSNGGRSSSRAHAPAVAPPPVPAANATAEEWATWTAAYDALDAAEA